MSNSEISIDHLRTSIEEAFSNIEPPASENIIEHDCPECRAVRRVFRDEDWRSIKPEKIDWGHDKLTLFTPQSFQYFLPAFMLYSVADPSSTVCELLVYTLTLNKGNNNEWWQKRIAKFTPDQKAACNLFLHWIQLHPEYASNSEDIGEALEKWWA